MSMIVCPLCGKSNVLERFNPSDYELDIYVYEVHGLGRGRGFRSGPRRSILGDDEITPLIKNRVLDLVQMLIDNNYLTVHDLKGELEFDEEAEDENKKETLKNFRLDENVS
ncbi:hypothetical protein KAS14_04030 [Candidatus Bathyarchaeota archaeon]|nr:hypothetical protein [Candidatus Bathyarchaeota archaeon]